MSINVSRESISTLMSELVENLPVDGDNRASISDFGKILFTEGQSRTNKLSSSSPPKETIQTSATTSEMTTSTMKKETNIQSHTDENTTPPSGGGSNKRVYTEIKGVPRQKTHDISVVVTESGKIALSQNSVRKIMKSKDKAVPKRWTQEEDDRLRDAVNRHGEKNWKSIAEEVPGRNHTQCLQRWTKVLAPGLIKGHWRPEEDDLLKQLVAEGRKNWGQVASRIPGRTSKQCRERWYNHLDPSIVRGEYTAEEDRVILHAQARLGNRWSAIAAMLPGRTEDAVKIRWKSLCRVRKGQVRRGSHGEKSKTPTNSNSDSGVHSPMSSSNPAAAMDMNSGVQMQNDVGYGSMQQQQAAAMGMGIVNNRLQVPMSHGIPTNPMTMMNPMQTQMGYYPQAHMNTFNPMGQTNMYTNMMQMAGTIAGDPTGSGIPGQEFNIDRRANAVNLSTNGGGLTPTSYAAAVSNPYNTGNGQFGTGSSAHIFANQVGIYGQTMPQMMMNSQQMQYMNPAANFAFAQHQQATPAAVSTLAATSSVNPVANFIQQQQQRQVQVQQTSPSPSTQQQQNKQAAFNPVAAFIEQQKRQKQESGATKLAAPFNPAAAFAQQAAKSSGKPPMIGTGFTTSNSSTLGGGTAGSSANRDTSTEDDGQEPSWKKVKPRTSIDAARASAARRLRNSVSATASTGRPSLDVFLNEIGDIGRISDLKMDEFQTLDEMWRVSDDMSRLSL